MSSTWFTALAIGAALTAAVAAQGPHQLRPGQTHKPDHMDHRFDDPERYAKSFDDPARDAWQMPDRVIAALNLKAGQKVADTPTQIGGEMAQAGFVLDAAHDFLPRQLFLVYRVK